MGKKTHFDHYLKAYKSALVDPGTRLSFTFSELPLDDKLAFLKGYLDGLQKQAFTSSTDLETEITRVLVGLQEVRTPTAETEPVGILPSVEPLSLEVNAVLDSSATTSPDEKKEPTIRRSRSPKKVGDGE